MGLEWTGTLLAADARDHFTQPLKIYSNHMAKEMLPGMIKPLVWSVNIPLKSEVFVQFLNEMLGETGVQAAELIRSILLSGVFQHGRPGTGI